MMVGSLACERIQLNSFSKNRYLCMSVVNAIFCVLKDLKDYMRQAGEVTYADAHKEHKNEG